MPLRFGPGPVFVSELIAVARRWQTYLHRAAMGFVLLVVLIIVFVTLVPGGDARQLSLADGSTLGLSFSQAVLTAQLALVVLLAPIATAEAICSEKARNKLELMLVTDLSNTEIILGILGSQLVTISSWILVSLPVMFIAGLLGGISWEFVTCGLVVIFGAGIVATTLSMAYAVGAEKPRKVIWHVYGDINLWFMSHIILKGLGNFPAASDWAFQINPYALLLSPIKPEWGISLTHLATYLAIAISVSTLLAALASWRLRSFTQRQRQKELPHWKSSINNVFLNEKLLDDHPLRWYERHRRIGKPTESAGFAVMAIAWIALLFVVLITAGSAAGTGIYLAGIQILCGVLWQSFDTATALASERTRGSLSVLLATPFTSTGILFSKAAPAFTWAVLMVFCAILMVAVDCIRHHVGGSIVESFILVVVSAPYLLAACLFFVCTSLLMATLFRDAMHAAGAAVTFTTIIALVWPYVIHSVAGSNHMTWILLGCSPPATFFMLESMAYHSDLSSATTAMVIWTGIYGCCSMVIYHLTLFRFDQSFGRITQRLGSATRPAITPANRR